MEIIVNYEEKLENDLALSIDRYLEFALRLNQLQDNENKKIEILLVGIDEDWDADEFIKKLHEKHRDIDGILFLTMEEFPRGDRTESNLNKSRMIREMLENSYNALTANYSNVILKACQLVSWIIKHNTAQKKFSDISDKFGKLQAKIVSELDRQKNFLQDLKKQSDKNNEIPEYDKNKPLSYLSRFYLLGGIHSSTLGHSNLRELYNSLENGNNGNNSPGSESKKDTTMEVTKAVKIEDSWKKVKLLETLYDLAFIAASNPFRFPPPKILIIDDRPGIVIDNFNKRRIINYFPPDTEVYITDAGEWEKFLHNHSYWENMYSKEAKLSLIKLESNFKSPKNDPNKDLFEEVKEKNKDIKYKKFIFDFIVVDLLLGDYNEGNQIINNLVNFRNIFNRQCQEKEERTYFDIIVLSLSEEAHDISRALNEGSLYYVHKSRPFMLPAVIAQLEKGREILEQRDRDKVRPQKARIFGKLYRLPEILKRRLKSEPFLDLPGKEYLLEKFNLEDDKFIKHLNDYFKTPAHEWIKNMPKADLHFHLGGSIPPDDAFCLSWNMLASYYNSEPKCKYEIMEKYFKEICEFLMIILNEKTSKILNLFTIFKAAIESLLKKDDSFFAKRILEMDILELCSNGKADIKKDKCLRIELENLLKNTNQMNPGAVIEDLEKLGVIVFSCNGGEVKTFEDGLNSIDYNEWLNKIKKRVERHFNRLHLSGEKFEKITVEKTFFDILIRMNEEGEFVSSNCKEFEPFPKYQLVNIFNVIIGMIQGKEHGHIENFWNQLNDLKDMTVKYHNLDYFQNLVEFYMHGIGIRCKVLFEKIKKIVPEVSDKKLKNIDILNHFISAQKRKTTSLSEYLGGNEFIGSHQLKIKENIFSALYSVIKRNIEDNARCLEIRLSPDGYTGENLTMQEAIRYILEYTDLITFYFYGKGKPIRVNYIFCVKRHKPPDQAAIEVSGAITNREREIRLKKIVPPVTKDNIDALKYQWKPSRVVGVDLAGIEKENPASKFVNDFFPLFKTSFFITVHAGEEDTARSIWEAIYLLHANRIGHGLTLKDYQYLTKLFRDLQICIEMNPISNLLTNPDIEEEYAFYEFVNEGIKVTINTDNQSVSESTLSEEYLKAAELYQKHRNNRKKSWISKWDMLRVIKNGFSGAFLDREEKRNLMRAVEEEIYQKIIGEYGC